MINYYFMFPSKILKLSFNLKYSYNRLFLKNLVCLSLLIFTNAITLNAQTISVTLTKSEIVCELAKASVTIVSGTLPVNILWSNGSAMSSIDQLEPGDYSVKVTDGTNKDTTIYFNIQELVCEPIAQNHFTPNADGFNDTWNIQRLEKFPDFDLYVYNRWGQQVHHQKNQYTPWDGTSLNIPLPDATYYYILFLSKSDKKKFIKGDISIIR